MYLPAELGEVQGLGDHGVGAGFVAARCQLGIVLIEEDDDAGHPS